MRFPFSVCSLTAFLFLFIIALPLSAQSRKELVDRRKRLLDEIKQTEQELQKTQKNKTAELDRYFAMQKQVQKRQQLIATLQEEVDAAQASIDRSNEVLFSLENDVDRLRQEYADMLRVAYRHKLNQTYLLFLFSANSINDAFRRWQYLRQYDRFRKRQAALIVETQQMLRHKAEQLAARKAEKIQLLTSAQEQRSLLNRELQDKDRLLKNLKADEGRLVSELERQRQAHEQLNNAIEAVIREEMARKRKTSRTPEAVAASNAEEIADAGASGNFLRRKGSLPWPVNDGEITRSFGTQPHPTIKSVQITNNGIDIRTTERSSVFAVFEGEVAGTQYIPGYQYMVILRHGQYYTVYSNLEEIFVKRGESIAARQPIGRLGNRKPEVHFEVWRDKQRLDPVLWVSKP